MIVLNITVQINLYFTPSLLQFTSMFVFKNPIETIIHFLNITSIENSIKNSCLSL